MLRKSCDEGDGAKISQHVVELRPESEDEEHVSFQSSNVEEELSLDGKFDGISPMPNMQLPSSGPIKHEESNNSAMLNDSVVEVDVTCEISASNKHLGFTEDTCDDSLKKNKLKMDVVDVDNIANVSTSNGQLSFLQEIFCSIKSEDLIAVSKMD